MFARSSPETIYRRFHIPYQEVPGWMLSLMLGTHHPHKEALVAVAEARVVGHAMYVWPGDDAEAEMAIVVEDRWQSMGVGKSLLLELVQRARSGGIETFIGEVLGHNQPMLALAGALSGTSYIAVEGVRRVCMPLRVPAPAAVAQTVWPAA